MLADVRTIVLTVFFAMATILIAVAIGLANRPGEARYSTVDASAAATGIQGD
jgi:hypothetical protein